MESPIYLQQDVNSVFLLQAVYQLLIQPPSQHHLQVELPVALQMIVHIRDLVTHVRDVSIIDLDKIGRTIASCTNAGIHTTKRSYQRAAPA